MKERLLAALRASPGPKSGERLGKDLGISRVAVWKHMKALKDLGYPIRAQGGGYLLEGDADFLHPWEIAAPGFDLAYRDRVETTMEEAKRLRPREGSIGSVVVAGTQAGGRGRLGRVWESEAGGLYFTVKLERRVPLGLLPRFPLLAAALAAEILEETAGLAARAKWPNDILVGDEKIGGVLLDAETAGDLAERLSLGIGLNLNNLPRGERAVSVLKLRGIAVQRRKVLARFLEAFGSALADPSLEAAIPRWKARSATLGRDVRVLTAWGEAFSGRACGIDPAGALVVLGPDGEKKSFLYADCRHREPRENRISL